MVAHEIQLLMPDQHAKKTLQARVYGWVLPSETQARVEWHGRPEREDLHGFLDLFSGKSLTYGIAELAIEKVEVQRSWHLPLGPRVRQIRERAVPNEESADEGRRQAAEQTSRVASHPHRRRAPLKVLSKRRVLAHALDGDAVNRRVLCRDLAANHIGDVTNSIAQAR